MAPFKQPVQPGGTRHGPGSHATTGLSMPGSSLGGNLPGTRARSGLFGKRAKAGVVNARLSPMGSAGSLSQHRFTNAVWWQQDPHRGADAKLTLDREPSTVQIVIILDVRFIKSMTA